MSETSDPRSTAASDRVWDVGRLVLDVVVLALAVWALQRGLSFRPLAAYFPVAAAGLIVVAVTVQLGIDVSSFVRGRPVVMAGMDVSSPAMGMGMRGLLQVLRYVAWFTAFVVLVWALGVFVSAAVFVAAFLRVEARWGWTGIGLTVVAVLVATYLMLGGLDLSVPRGWLELGHDLL